MLNKVRLNTCVVEGSREARTVLAIKAAFVESEAGNLEELLAYLSLSVKIERGILCLWARSVIKCKDVNTH